MYDIAAAAAAVSAVTWELSIKNTRCKPSWYRRASPVGGSSQMLLQDIALLSLLGKLQKFSTYSRHKKNRHIPGVSKRGSFEEIY